MAVAPPPAVGPTGPTTAATATGTSSAPQAPVAEQVVSVVAPLARQADGSYSVSLQLHPADLGAVRLELHVADGTVSVALHADSTAGRDVLAGHVSDLRSALADAGLTAGSVDVSGGDGSAYQPPQWAAPSRPTHQDDDTGAELPTPAVPLPEPPPAVAGSLDLRL
jgi:flagellar hook-length control protein FliK